MRMVITLPDKNYAKVEYEHDGNGNVTSQAFFDEDSAEVVVPDGYHKVRYTYNDKNQKVTERYYDADDKLVVTKIGTAGIDYSYDGRGRIASLTYLNENEKPAPNKDGYLRSVTGANRRYLQSVTGAKLHEFIAVFVDGGYNTVCKRSQGNEHF